MPETEKYAIGVDLGGTSVKLGIVTRNGKIIKKTSVETKAEGGPQSLFHRLNMVLIFCSIKINISSTV